eukprot:TRINITY_DN16451_c0_g1_i1.p1 TRINITY_DN16451_c0_g1~~TRINITY_DN16451_c0_g1_i1.p1  ORF type:complete len:193 (+),score=28.90 TRINITY_DN16451_c0_g1_i1:76-654(+)
MSDFTTTTGTTLCRACFYKGFNLDSEEEHINCPIFWEENEREERKGPMVCKSTQDLRVAYRKKRTFIFDPEIYWLDLSHANIDSSRLSHISELLLNHTALIHLDISSNNIQGEALPFISKIMQNTHLQVLNLGANMINTEGFKYLLQSLEQNTTLTRLNLNLNEIKVEGAKEIHFFKLNSTLCQLNLEDTNC